MRYLLGAEVERLYAEIERKVHTSCEDLLTGLLRFSNGVIGARRELVDADEGAALTVTGEGNVPGRLSRRLLV